MPPCQPLPLNPPTKKVPENERPKTSPEKEPRKRTPNKEPRTNRERAPKTNPENESRKRTPKTNPENEPRKRTPKTNSAPSPAPKEPRKRAPKTSPEKLISHSSTVNFPLPLWETPPAPPRILQALSWGGVGVGPWGGWGGQCMKLPLMFSIFAARDGQYPIIKARSVQYKWQARTSV